jgi:hypothetical protein
MRHVALLRWILVALALLWSALILGRRRLPSLLAGVLFVEAAVGFWVLALGRPYGLLVDAQATRQAAEASVVAETGRSDEGALAASEGASRAAVLLARLPISRRCRLLLPTLLPFLAPAAVGLAVALLWRRRDLAILGASLWLAFGTGDLDALGGEGFVTGIWARPLASLLVVGLVPLVLALSRVRPRAVSAPLLGLAAAACLGLAPAVAPSPGALGALRWLTLDQGLWLPLGLYGLARSRDVAPRALALGGAVALFAGGLGAPVEAWAGHVLYRIGMLLAAAEPVASLAAALGRVLAARPALAGRGLEPLSLGLAALFAGTAPGSFLVWWDPPKLDPVAKASLAPLSPNLLGPMDWVRRETPRDAVFIADEDYSAALAALAGRRVLRAPLLEEARDDERRVRTERLVLSGRDPGPLRARYRVSHVLAAPGDFRAHGLRAPEDLEGRGRFRRLYVDDEGLRVYALE